MIFLIVLDWSLHWVTAKYVIFLCPKIRGATLGWAKNATGKLAYNPNIYILPVLPPKWTNNSIKWAFNDIDADILCDPCMSKKDALYKSRTNPTQNHDDYKHSFRMILIYVHAILTILCYLCCCCSNTLWWNNYTQRYLDAAQIYFQNGPIADLQIFGTHPFQWEIPLQNNCQ